MNISNRDLYQKEKDLYYTVLSFLRNVRKVGKTNDIEWRAYQNKLKGVAPSSDMFKAADMWTMDNLDQFSPENCTLPPLDDVEGIVKLSPKFASQLMEALYYGMLNPSQANLLTDEILENEPENVTNTMLEEVMVKLWIGNAQTYKGFLKN